MSQRQFLEMRIELLEAQIQEQNEREQNVKKLNETLSEQVFYQREIQQQNFRLTQLNEKLMEGLKEARRHHEEEISYYDSQIGKLKGEISDKTNEIQRNRVQFSKRELNKEEKIIKLESIIDKKCYKINELEKKIHEQSISRLKQRDSQNLPQLQQVKTNATERWVTRQDSSGLGASTLRISQIDNFDSENNMRASNISGISKRSKADYMQMNKSEIKVMMGAIIKSKREIEKGINKTGDARNKTMMG